MLIFKDNIYIYIYFSHKYTRDISKYMFKKIFFVLNIHIQVQIPRSLKNTTKLK